MKATALLAKAFSNPRELADRLLTFAESRIYKPTLSEPDGLLMSDREMYRASGNLDRFSNDQALRDITEHVSHLQPEIPLPPSGISHNASFDLARFCYCWCRANEPALVIETGVANGVTSAFILRAMQENDMGELWSIDLPSLGADRFVGFLVPKELRARWTIHRGRSRRLLPELLKKGGKIGAFLHDSLHTSRNMRFEYQTAWPFIASGGALISDDATYFSNAFQQFASNHDTAFVGIHPAGFGVAIKPMIEAAQ